MPKGRSFFKTKSRVGGQKRSFCENYPTNGWDFTPLNRWCVVFWGQIAYTLLERVVLMDQIGIGKFIAACRKEKNLTQAQLAQKLCVTDRAVSKWETGRSLPDASLMLSLCEILGVSVNELLRGEHEKEPGEDQKNEQLLLDMAKELEQKNKTLWRAMWVLMTVSIVALLGGILAAALLVPEGPWQLVVILAATVLFMFPCLYALKLEISVGAYRCKNCGQEILPS